MSDRLRQGLVKAICDEKTAEFQYQMAEHLARGTGYMDAVPEYRKHADEEREHLQKLLKRAEQLNILLTYDLVDFAQQGNRWVPITFSEVDKQLDVLIDAEKDAQRFYAAMVAQAREEQDWITQQLFKQLLADECEHETDLRRIREGL